MDRQTIIRHWDGAAPGWVKWEETISDWMRPATAAMLAMAGIGEGDRVLDVACGAGSQTLRAAQQVGDEGHVVAIDISATMLDHVQRQARSEGLDNITTVRGAAEDIDFSPGGFDAVICRLGLMLFTNPRKAVSAVRRELKPGGKFAAVVFTEPEANPFMAKPMQILLRHAGKKPPSAGQPGIFALGAPGVIEGLLTEAGFVDVEHRKVPIALRLPSIASTFEMMQEAFGAYRAVVSDCSEDVKKAAWSEVRAMLNNFESEAGFEAFGEVAVAVGVKPGGNGNTSLRDPTDDS